MGRVQILFSRIVWCNIEYQLLLVADSPSQKVVRPSPNPVSGKQAKTSLSHVVKGIDERESLGYIVSVQG